MTLVSRSRTRGAGRAQLHETALRLFGRHGVDGTSLQAIADEMGVSKAAVYYHYRSKDDLVLGVLAPALDELSAILRRVGVHRGLTARREAFLAAFVPFVMADGYRFSVFASDPYVTQLVPRVPYLRQWWAELARLLTGADDDQGRAALSVFLHGVAGPLRDPTFAALDAAVVRDCLIECGRRLLQVRRRPALPLR